MLQLGTILNVVKGTTHTEKKRELQQFMQFAGESDLRSLLVFHMRHCFRYDTTREKSVAWFVKDGTWGEISEDMTSHFIRAIVHVYLERTSDFVSGQPVYVVNKYLNKILNDSRSMLKYMQYVAKEDSLRVQGIRIAMRGVPYHMMFKNGIYDVVNRCLDPVGDWYGDNGCTYDEDILESAEFLDIDQRIRDLVASNEDEYNYLKIIIGYLCSGTTHLEGWIWMAGDAGAGKSTLRRMISVYLGKYCTAASPQLVLSNNPDVEQHAIANIAGAWAFTLDDMKTAYNSSMRPTTIHTTTYKLTTDNQVEGKVKGGDRFTVVRTWAGSLMCFNGKIAPSKADTGYEDVFRRLIFILCSSIPKSDRVKLDDLDVPGSAYANAASMYCAECVALFHDAYATHGGLIAVPVADGGLYPDRWNTASQEVLYDPHKAKLDARREADRAKKMAQLAKQRNYTKEAYDLYYEYSDNPEDKVEYSEVDRVVAQYVRELLANDPECGAAAPKGFNGIYSELRRAGIPVETNSKLAVRRSGNINYINHTIPKGTAGKPTAPPADNRPQGSDLGDQGTDEGTDEQVESRPPGPAPDRTQHDTQQSIAAVTQEAGTQMEAQEQVGADVNTPAVTIPAEHEQGNVQETEQVAQETQQVAQETQQAETDVQQGPEQEAQAPEMLSQDNLATIQDTQDTQAPVDDSNEGAPERDFETRFAEAFANVFKLNDSKAVIWDDVVELGKQVMLEKRANVNLPMIESVGMKVASHMSGITGNLQFTNSNRHGWKTPSRKNYKLLRCFTYKTDSQQYAARFKEPAKRKGEAAASTSKRSKK
jgi:hypothetical protein